MKASQPQALADEWKKIRLLAEKYLSFIESNKLDDAEKARQKILDFLNNLIKSNPNDAGLLASKADYLERATSREVALVKAYSISKKTNDDKNATLISSSLCTLYAEELIDLKKLRLWLERLENDLRLHFDADESANYLALLRKV